MRNYTGAFLNCLGEGASHVWKGTDSGLQVKLFLSGQVG